MRIGKRTARFFSQSHTIHNCMSTSISIYTYVKYCRLRNAEVIEVAELVEVIEIIEVVEVEGAVFHGPFLRLLIYQAIVPTRSHIKHYDGGTFFYLTYPTNA